MDTTCMGKVRFAFFLMTVLILSYVGACAVSVEGLGPQWQAVCGATGVYSAEGQEISAADVLCSLSSVVIISAQASTQQFVTVAARRVLSQENRLYFNSIFAVLFKIAMIPEAIFAVAAATGRSISGALRRMIRFVHNSDGKKDSFYLSIA